MGFLSDFKDFLCRGNILDLAIGVVIGAAFTAVVNAIVADMLSPIIEWMFPVSFENLFIHLRCPDQDDGKCAIPYQTLKEAKDKGAIVFAYGHTFEIALQFVFTAFVLFLILRAYMRIRKPAPAAEDKKCTHCIQPVNIKATRCQHCAGQLTVDDSYPSIRAM